METTPKYIVKSRTNRSEQGRPDLCWMDISIKKLDECCAAGEKFYFKCEIDGNLYKYFMSGEELRKAFLDNHVGIKNNKNSICYSFWLNYAEGEVYNKPSKSEGKLVCRLQATGEVVEPHPNFTKNYMVKSRKTCSEQGHPDLCWMNIGIDKLDECCAAGKKYNFECEIYGDSYKFFIDGKELRRAFLENDVTIMKAAGAGTKKYSFYFNYAKGEIYDKLAESGSRLVCRLRSFDGLGYVCGEQELEKNLGENISVIANLIAKTAVWAPVKYHLDCRDAQGTCFAKYPNVRRKKASEKRGIDPENPQMRLDDNSYPNRQMKEMGKEVYHCNFKGYTVCHLWDETCYNEKYHTCFANLVLLPAALSSLTDFNQEIQSILKYRSYDLYHWLPDGEEAPKKPKFYPEHWVTPPAFS